MKKYLLCGVFGIMMCSYAAGQNYHPFPTIYGNWLYQYYDQFGNPVHFFTNIILSGDTIIGTHSYKKLSASINLGGVDGNCIREENKKIYYYHPDSLAEYVLYDFNLEAGDTLFNPYSCCPLAPIDTVVIYSVDSVLLSDNQYHKMWQTMGCDRWYDGVGSDVDLLNPYHGCYLSPHFNLECFTGDSGLVYQWNINCLVGINGRDENISTSVYPNPITTQLNITLANNQSSIIILYDITSRKLLQQSFVNSVSINTTQLESGIYFYEVRSDNKMVRNGKVVKE